MLPTWTAGQFVPCTNATPVNTTASYCVDDPVVWLGVVPIAMLEQLAVFVGLVVVVGMLNYLNRRTLVHFLELVHEQHAREQKGQLITTAPDEAIDPVTGRLLEGGTTAAALLQSTRVSNRTDRGTGLARRSSRASEAIRVSARVISVCDTSNNVSCSAAESDKV